MTEHEWYSPGQIRFNRVTSLWLIQNLDILRGGKWPPDVGNYVDRYGQRTASKAAFTTPIEYAAEIESRMEECGIDGLILEAVECWGKTDDSLSKYFKMPAWSIRKRLKNALSYVASGNDRRWHNTNKRKGKTYREFLERNKNKGA